MGNRKAGFELKLFLKYLCKYVSVAAVFIILIIYVYHVMYTVTKNNTIQDEADRVYKSVEMLDDKIEAISAVMRQVQKDSSFQILSRTEGELKTPDYIDLLKAQETLNELRRQYDLDLKAYVVFEKNGVFVSELLTSPEYKSIFTHFLKYEKSGVESIRQQALDMGREMIFIPVQDITYLNGERINGITCIVKGVSENRRLADYAVVYTLDMALLLDTLDLKDTEDEFVQITDSKGTILCNYNYDGDVIQMNGQMIRDEVLGGDTYTVIGAKTEYKNLSVVKGIKLSVFEEKIGSVLNVIKIYIACAIAFSIAVSLFLSLRQFSGVRRILGVLRMRSNPSLKSNEYKYIYSSVKDVFDENKKYEEDLQVIKNSMKDRLIEKSIMQGIYSEKEKNEFLKYTGIKIEFFCIVSISITQETGRTGEFDGKRLERYGKTVRCLTDKTAEQFERVISAGRGMEEINLLILLEKEEEVNCERIYSVMKATADEVLHHFGQPIAIGISRIGWDISNIHTCYLQARRAIRQIEGSSELPVAMAAAQYAENDILEDFNIDQQLFDLIMTEDREGIEKFFKRLENHIRNCAFASEQEIMQLFFQIRSPIKKARKRILKDEKECVIPDYDDSSSVARLLETLEGSALRLCECSLHKKKAGSNSLRREVMEYLMEQYSDPNLCANMAAEKFSISEKYVYKLVKEETGVSIGKYVETLRMQKAKELLKNTDLSAAEISQMSGFYSITTFYKAFNRVFGVAPIAYREIQKAEK